MNLLGLTGIPKLDQARRALACFVDLLRTDATHQFGLITFSTTASTAFDLLPINSINKEKLVGPSPLRNMGIIGKLHADGSTTIGGGLELAQMQFPVPAPAINTPVILLMTDGLQNTTPLIEEVEDELGQSKLCIIGFGSEANLDGQLLTQLSVDHKGLYS